MTDLLKLRSSIAILLALGCQAQQKPAPMVEEAVAPAYPAPALSGRIAGSVMVDVRVSEQGAVIDAAVAEGDALLRQASLDAARLWRFQPQPSAGGAKLIFSYRFMAKNTPEAQLGAVFRPPYWVEVRKILPEPVSHIARNSSDAARQTIR